MKRILFFRRLNGALTSLPDVFDIQPSTDYQALISHSSAELMAKAWNRTGMQMKQAIKTIEKRHPDVRRKLATPT